MTDLVERLNLIIAQCRDSKESADLWTEVRDEIERLRAVLLRIAEVPHLEVKCEHHPNFPCPICAARIALAALENDDE